jgi:hypothetical protein
MTCKIQWVPYGKATLRDINRQLGGPPEIKSGAFAFVGSEIVGSAYTFGDERWYGTFFDVRIGSCRDEAMARANVEHRWKLARKGENPYGAV